MIFIKYFLLLHLTWSLAFQSGSAELRPVDALHQTVSEKHFSSPGQPLPLPSDQFNSSSLNEARQQFYAELKRQTASELGNAIPPQATNAKELGGAVRLPSGDYIVEGDILVPSNEWEQSVFAKKSGPSSQKGVQRGAICVSCRRWPLNPSTGKYEVFWEYGADQNFSPEDKHLIEWTLKHLEMNTNIRFFKRTNQPGFISVKQLGGCFSEVGYVGDRDQVLSLGNGCVTRGLIVHEFFHALGVFHEHTRADRDDYLDINWSNVAQGVDNGNFKKIPLVTGSLDELVTPYDFKSVMQYHDTAFVIDKTKPGMIIKPGRNQQKYTDMINANKIAASSCDFAEINHMYPGNVSGPPCVPHTPVVEKLCHNDDGKLCPVYVSRDECDAICEAFCAWGVERGNCMIATEYGEFWQFPFATKTTTAATGDKDEDKTTKEDEDKTSTEKDPNGGDHCVDIISLRDDVTDDRCLQTCLARCDTLSLDHVKECMARYHQGGCVVRGAPDSAQLRASLALEVSIFIIVTFSMFLS